MAMYMNRKLMLNADQNMAIIFVYVLVFIQIHIGYAEDNSAHQSVVSESETPFPGDKYYVLNGADNYSFSAGIEDTAQRVTGTPSSSPGEASINSARVSVVTDDLGLLLDFDKSSITRFIPSLSSDCLKLLQDYASLSSDVVYCTLAFSKPLLFCESCVNKFIATNKKYKEIQNMTMCSDSLLSSDRVQIIRESHSFLKRIWEKGSCENCFQDMASCQDHKVPCPVREDVLKFQSYNNQTLNCFEAVAESGMNVCLNCSDIYKTLTTFYTSMGNVEDVCSDCVEQMNSTRKEWSITYNCTCSRKDVVSIVAVSVFVCSLPLFFYVGSKVHTVKSEYKLMKQNRYKKQHRLSRWKLPQLPGRGEDFLTNEST